MDQEIDFKELKGMYSNIVKAVKFEDAFDNVKTLGAVDIVFSDNLVYCVVGVFDAETLELIETKELATKELMPYSPTWISYREGSPILEVCKKLENQPDVFLIAKPGTVNKDRVSTPGYVGVLLNKPTIGVSKDLTYGLLDVDRVMYREEQMGLGLKTREFAKPIYVSPGFGVSLESSISIVKKVLGDQKMPMPIHVVHKLCNKLKKGGVKNE
jgi:deoxyribonuclease V